MRYEEALRKHEPLTPYERGYVHALHAYSWQKDGTLYVGTTGKTLGYAADEFLTGWRERHEHSFSLSSGVCICGVSHELLGPAPPAAA